MYGDKVQIRDINGQIEVDSSFDGMYDDSIYVIIDKINTIKIFCF